jgi:two-component system KDP operon response regulator KdpE
MNVSKQKILLIEDEKRIAGYISRILHANGYDTVIAATAKEGLSLLSSHCPELVILDLGLPDMDGMDFLKTCREWSSVPIIVVSARSHERDKVEALDGGADDYITKPFGSSELLARIRTAMRHSQNHQIQGTPLNLIRTGELVIDYERRIVTISGKEIHLTQNEYKILSVLGKNIGKVMTYDAILKELWGPTVSSNNQALRVHMANIRRKIEENPAEPKYVLTEVGVGYRMVEL